VQFGCFLSKFGCYGNSLGSLKILDNMFVIADLGNPTLPKNLVSISSTQMKLCLLESLAYLYHCGYRLFVDFFVINSGNCFNFLIISQMGTRVHGSIFPIAYLNSPTPKILLFMWKKSSIFVRT